MTELEGTMVEIMVMAQNKGERMKRKGQSQRTVRQH